MTAALRLFRRFSLRHLKRRKLRTLLAGVSIALGVALFLSMRISEASILRAFRKSADALAGKADVVVVRGTGIDAGALARIEKVGRLRAAPVVQDATLAPDLNAQLIVLGIDFLRDAKLREYRFAEKSEIDPIALMLVPNSVVIARSFAVRHGLKLRSTLKLATRAGTKSFTVAGILEDAGPARALAGQVVVMSVASAQAHFGRKGQYDRIEVAFDGATADDLRRELGPEYQVRPTAKSDPVLDYILAQQRTVLFGITLVAMIIGVFIVYNSGSLSVVERVKEIGILRALGARRREIVGALLLEALFVGFLATAVGTAMGIGLSRFFIDRAAQQMNVLTYLVDVRDIVIPPDGLVVALFVGLVTAAAGAFFPAIEASRVPPMVAIRKAAYRRGRSRKYVWGFSGGSVFLVAAIVLGFLPSADMKLLIASFVLSFGGMALMLPQLLLTFGGAMRMAARRLFRIEAYLAFDTLVKSPSRTSLTVLAFAGSLAMIVAVSGTVAASERAVGRWLDAVLPFDLTVQLNDLTAGAYGSATFPDSVLNEVREDPRVGRCYGVRALLTPYRDATVLVLAIDFRTWATLRAERGSTADPAAELRMVEECEKGGAVLSENFADLYRVRVGEEIELATPGGMKRIRVVATLEDYSWPRGVVMFDRAVYRELWDDETLTYVDLEVKQGADLPALRRDLVQRFLGRHRVFIYDARETRDAALSLIRDFFRLADAQILLAIVIGAIGVINALLISVMTQSRQIGLLRAVGASSGQINASLALEAVFLGLMSGLLGCGIGLFLARFPMAKMAMQESGYSMPFVCPMTATAVALLAGVGIALVSSLLPIRFTRRIDVIEAIGYE